MVLRRVLSRIFGDVGSSSLRNAKGLASGRDPGRRLLSWRRVGLIRKGTPRHSKHLEEQMIVQRIT